MNAMILIEPEATPSPTSSGLDRYRALAREIGRRSPDTMRVSWGSLDRAPAVGHVLFVPSRDATVSLERCSLSLRRRLLLLDVSWQTALKSTGDFALAGAVDSLRLSQWFAGSPNGGMIGLKYLARPAGMSLSNLPWLSTPSHAMMHGPKGSGLPHILASYCAANDQDGLPLPGMLAVQGRPVRVPEPVSVFKALRGVRLAREKAGLGFEEAAARAGIDAELARRFDQAKVGWGSLREFRRYSHVIRPDWGWVPFDPQAADASPDLESFPMIGDESMLLNARARVTRSYRTPAHAEH